MTTVRIRSPVTVPSKLSSTGQCRNSVSAIRGGGGDANGPTVGIRDGGVADTFGDFENAGFDCSGIMIYAFAGVGISLPHYSGYQYTAGRQVPASQMKRGDLIFYGPNASQHEALYLGNNQMLESPQSGDVVKVSPVRWDGMVPNVTRLL